MSPEEKIGQLFMVLVTSVKEQANVAATEQLIRDEQIGGLIFSTGGPVRQAQLTNRYQNASKVPLLIGMDAEWGLSMRLDSAYAFPWNMTLGAIKDSTIIENVGYRIGRHARRLGVHINFAPDIDININPQNPIIGNRSFGQDPENVAQKGIALMKGMHRAGLLSSGKHFPGHGDTAVDSHKGLPLIEASRERLDSVELLPFRRLIAEGLSSVMAAHLNVPALDGEAGKPSSLSEPIISGLLKDELGFKGLVFTDALNMSGVATFEQAGETELQAFLAGNDMLLMPKDLKAAKQRLMEAYENGRISEARLQQSVKKILMAKYKAGLHHYSPVVVEGLYEDLNSLEDDLVYQEAVENALTVVKNDLNLIGIKKLENKKIAYVKFGDEDSDPFLQALKRYTDVTQVNGKDIATLKENLEGYNLVIIGFHKNNQNPWAAYKFSEREQFWLHEIAREPGSNVILTIFAKPYALLDMPTYNEVDGVVVAYQNSRTAQDKAAQLIFGAIPAKGVLPVTAHPEFPVNTSISTDSLLRFSYGFPEQVGMSSKALAQVDKLVQDGLDSLMFPGAQVLVARRGKVIYHKAFGKPTYDSQEQVTTDHIYDLASLTKILATVPALMKLEEEGTLGLNATFQELIPEFTETELSNVTVLKALSHYGRLPAWIAFYLDTLNEDRRPSTEFYKNHPADGFSVKVTDRMYLSDAYQDSIYNRIGRQHLKSNRYRYSDVAYYVMKKYIEETQHGRLDHIMDDFLYRRIGANSTAYNPLEAFPLNRIVPSEEDTYFRYQRIQGYVHDMGAAMQGGVGGHAGLFSNANDVAKIMQMYLQGGYYGGERFLEQRTVEKFNKCYFCDKNVRRGVGFDKPDPHDNGPTCGCVSRKSFGHSGFTGTYTWADPEEEVVYVFLSNRTYPTATNTLLVRSALRTRIQKAIYDSIIY
jgi:beta-glucosidase-like glycosyl hydrolase/CubicO group peptidase (beta-lactamase class C family)